MTRWPMVWVASLASALLGVVVSTLSDVAFRGSAAENLASGMIAACLGILFANLLEKARTDVEAELLAELRRDAQLRVLVEDARRARKYVHGLRNEAIQTFFADRLRELCTETAWSDLAQGRLAITPLRELLFNRDALKICTRRVRAIAYEDGGFWELPEGQAFLEASREMIVSGKEITRIFVFDTQIRQSDLAQMRRQASLGIKVRVLPLSSVAEGDGKDFVVYDDIAVRVAEPAVGERKSAVLYISERQVRSYVERYKNLEERSLPLDDYLTTLDTTLDTALDAKDRSDDARQV